jgi:hypothetical protein
VGLERSPLGLVSTTEELLGRKNSCSGLENLWGIQRTDFVAPLYPKKLALTSPTIFGRLVGIVHSQTQATEFSLVSLLINQTNFEHGPNSFVEILYKLRLFKASLQFNLSVIRCGEGGLASL